MCSPDDLDPSLRHTGLSAPAGPGPTTPGGPWGALVGRRDALARWMHPLLSGGSLHSALSLGSDVPRIPFPLGLEEGIDALWGPTAWP